MTTELDDLTLFERWRDHDDTSAGVALFRRHHESLYRFFEQKTAGEVSDLVQETFYQLVKSRDSFQHQASFKTFLFAIARHVLFAHWRKRAQARPALDFDELSLASLSTSIGTRLARREDQARLIDTIRTLPFDLQLLLELFYWHGLDREQLAEVFEVETATIGSRLHRVRKFLHDQLGGTAEPMRP